ncbi:MAG: cbdB 2 [Nocardioidaceae bacterium]|nr:cbdB 2 [Nocardioidaceae bacterium]
MTDLDLIQREATGTSPSVEAVAAFLFREARLADESRYDEWESLWDDDAIYWVPRKDDADPERDVSFLYDNRARIRSRVAQLRSGRRHSQTPPSKMRRSLANIEIVDVDGDLVHAAANFALYEHRHVTHVWAGRYQFTLRTAPDGLRLVRKTVLLINNEDAIRTIAFLL